MTQPVIVGIDLGKNWFHCANGGNRLRISAGYKLCLCRSSFVIIPSRLTSAAQPRAAVSLSAAARRLQ